MPILTPTDKSLYFPDLELTGDALLSAIARSQVLVEAEIGRSLELTQYKEILSVNLAYQTAHLNYLPIATTPAISVEARIGNYKDGFGRPIPMSQWFALTEADYQLDYETGQLNLMMSSGSRLPLATQVKATYTAGIDFNVNTATVRNLKTALGAVLSYANSTSYQGIAEMSVEGEYKVRYATATVATIPKNLLAPFAKYKRII